MAALVANVEEYAILLLDPAGHVTSWKSGAEQIKGYRAQEIIGQPFSVFYTPGDRAIGKPDIMLSKAAEQGRAEDEGWRVRKDGSHFWANVVITALHNDDVTLCAFGKVTRDLTERRDAEQKLSASETLRAGGLDAATEFSIIGTDLNGTITVFNTGAERLLGYCADEVIGQTTPEMFHDQGEVAASALELGVAPGMDVFTAAALRGEPKSRGFTYVCKNGSRIPVQLTVTVMVGADSTPIGFIGIARDIRVETQAMAAADDGERRWRTLLDHLPDTSVMVVDSDLRYRVAERAAPAAVATIGCRPSPGFLGDLMAGVASSPTAASPA